MNLQDAVKIFESFDNRVNEIVDPSNDFKEFTEYPADQVLEAQGIILNEAKQNLAFETAVETPAFTPNTKDYEANMPF